MKKINFFKPAIAVFLLFICQSVFAQKMESGKALDLITKNAPALNLSKQDVKNSIVTNAYYDKVSKLHLVYLQQSYLEVPVYNQIQVLAFKNGLPVSESGGRIFNIEANIADKKAIPSLSSKEAVEMAAASVSISTDILRDAPLTFLKTSPDKHRIEFMLSAISRENITTELLWVPTRGGSVRLAWQVKLLPKNTPDYWLIRIDAKNAEVLGKDNLTVYCNRDMPEKKFPIPRSGLLNRMKEVKEINLIKSPTTENTAQYRVIPYPAESVNHPGGTPVLVNAPWLMAGVGNDATTLKWHNDGATEYAYTRGNNVWALEDTAANNGGGASAPSGTPLPNLTFDFPFNGNLPPETESNLYFGITNLFYWNNIVHDIAYQYGFDEVSGNFQNSNQGRGGVEDDYVIADAQDGGGMNNAFFQTPPDGSKPRMTLGLYELDTSFKGRINLPTDYAGNFFAREAIVSVNNRVKDIGPVTGDLAFYIDDAIDSTHFACVPPINAGDLAGKIALIDRDTTCDFTEMIKNAQDAGAIAVLVINNEYGELITMNGSDNSITIPAFMVYRGLGDYFKAVIESNSVTFNVTLKEAQNLDSDLDNGIIVHEYTHGISNRLTGGPSTSSCLGGEETMGEGWSDYFALMLTTNWQTATIADGVNPRSHASYVNNQGPTGPGNRTYPYSTDMNIDPWTYADIEVYDETHQVGEVWASTLWDMTWNMIQIEGINTNLYNTDGVGGNSDALKLIILGMKLQPCEPGFLDGRDAILKADEILFNGKYKCTIWNAFARRGMGVNAIQASWDRTDDQVENFDIPSGATFQKSVDRIESPQNGILTYTFTVRAQCAGINDYKIVDTLPTNISYVSGGTYNATDRTVTFEISSLSAMQTATFKMTVKVNEGTYFAPSVLLSEPIADYAIPVTLTSTSTTWQLPDFTWKPSGYGHSSSYSLAAIPHNNYVFPLILTSSSPYTIHGHTQLSFWHFYSMEIGRDGGVVELSLDSTAWFDAEPYIVQNGYNTTLHTNSRSNLDGRRAFSGIQPNFVQTVINLSAFQNQAVYFRFRYEPSTVLDDGEMWVVDDILIKRKPAVYNIARVFDSGDQFQSLSDTITAITNVLPAVWDQFDVYKEGAQALLKWNTLQEFNTKNFEVERSTDGTHFTVIGTLPAQGHSSGITYYTFRDQAPVQGVNYYRIRLIDLDGKSSYSEVKPVVFEPAENRVILSPNPAKTQALLYVPGNNSVLKIQLLDPTGRVVNNYRMNGEKYQLPLSTLSAGVYYIHINGRNVDVMKKLVKK